jgi:hypothetical protein
MTQAGKCKRPIGGKRILVRAGGGWW